MKTNKRKNMYLMDKIARKVWCGRAILSYKKSKISSKVLGNFNLIHYEKPCLIVTGLCKRSLQIIQQQFAVIKSPKAASPTIKSVSIPIFSN